MDDPATAVVAVITLTATSIGIHRTLSLRR